jgi:hypothetical protein
MAQGDESEFDPLQLLSHLGDIERRLGAPTDTLRTLGSESDWSLVIKLAVLLDGAISESMAAVLDSRLGSVLSNHTLGGRTGKLAFAKAIEMLSGGEISFVDAVLTVRNKAAHGVSSMSFSLDDYVAGLAPTQRDNLRAKVARLGEPHGVSAQWAQMFDSDIKDALIAGTILLLLRLEIVALGAALEQAKRTADTAELDLLRKHNAGSRS